MTRVAIIDLGTNTFHLLIADVSADEYSVLHQEKRPVKLGQGGITKNEITPQATMRAVEVLLDFRAKTEIFCATRVIALGTSALRNANNAEEIIAYFRRETNINVTIISGDEEAKLIFEGIRYALKLKEEIVLGVDIGGGSVECIIGNATQILWKQSFEIGGQRLLEQFQHHDPITKQEVEALKDHFGHHLQSLFIALAKYKPLTLAGSSGTFETLGEMYSHRQGIENTVGIYETPLSISGFYEIHYDLLTKNRKERMLIPGMIEMRVDMIVVASCLIAFILKNYKFNLLRVSNYSLKEGVLISFREKPFA